MPAVVWPLEPLSSTSLMPSAVPCRRARVVVALRVEGAAVAVQEEPPPPVARLDGPGDARARPLGSRSGSGGQMKNVLPQ